MDLVITPTGGDFDPGDASYTVLVKCIGKTLPAIDRVVVGKCGTAYSVASKHRGKRFGRVDSVTAKVRVTVEVDPCAICHKTSSS